MAQKERRVMGPVDYLIVRFPGNKFSGKIVPELRELEGKGIIRIIDLVFVLKNAQGKLMVTEAKDLKGEAGVSFGVLAKHTDEWFSEGDIDMLAAELPNNCSAALLLFENSWAIRFKEALLDAEAELIDMGRIPPETVAKVEKGLTGKGGK
jgi:hypothetical protein